MAVYTHLSHAQIAAYLAVFNIGSLISFKGIDGGIENTNYFITTAQNGIQQDYVLTLFEDLTFQELPYFADLTIHLLANNVTVPAPIADQQGEVLKWLADKPTMLFPRFAGAHLARSEITPAACATIGTQFAHLHLAGQTFTQQRQAHRGASWWNQLAPRAAQCIPSEDVNMLLQVVKGYQSLIAQAPDLPIGVIHGDLFYDNVLFNEGQFSAIIDLYNACNDYLLFDVATLVNDWCIDVNGAINPVLYQAFIDAYHAIRPFTDNERKVWNLFLKTAAMRFWLSRLETFHGLDSHQRATGVTVLKDPDAFRDILRKRMQQAIALP